MAGTNVGAHEGADVENRAGLSRATCGWRLPGLDLEAVWNYWRDVHSPAISRRAGIHVYRHFRWAPVDPTFLTGVPEHLGRAEAGAQLQWMSDIAYRDEAALARFYASPDSPAVVAKILGDIDLIVDRSTTYLTLGPAMRTYADDTASPTPQGPPPLPHHGLFLRQSGSDDEIFRAGVRALAEAWSVLPGVLRVRLNLFERPDMEADRSAGYPVKTHPVEQQYQALIEIVTADAGAAAALTADGRGEALAGLATEVHAYPVSAVYSFVWDGRPTVAGLRGYPALQAIEALGADHAVDEGLLGWMYGPVVEGDRAGLAAAPR